jgi:hypothetical protein
MSSTKLLRLSFLLLIWVCFCCPGQAQPSAEELLDSADEILETVSRLRHLEVRRTVERGVKSRKEIEAFLIERIQKEYPLDEIKREERLLKKLGLIPPEMRLYEFMLELLTEQVAGYYDPYAEEFFIADWIPLEIQKPVMAHELTHALQDQHFDLERFLDRVEGNDDRMLAKNSLIEGDALLVMLDYALHPLGRSALDLPDIVAMNRAQLSFLDAQFRVFAGAPQYLRETLIFPYTYGARFLQSFVRRHSWEKVSDLYEDLPTSSEQILHPEKYITDRDEPTEMDTKPLRSQLEDPWKLVTENVLGEFTLYLLLVETLGEEAAAGASEGWDGDAVALLVDEESNECLLLTSIWDSESDAQEFFDGYSSLVRKKFSHLSAKSSRRSSGNQTANEIRTWEDRETRIVLTWAGRQVDLIELQK